ncbi:nitrogen fixation protein NIFU [Mesomycoplasma conjunctivae]|uniref:iron-sulfur cluster assembly scaffold protein n=1 Tax=Mesomycoplasma conjunctivae TaxID=45361 RepID=UPI0002E2C867|nr:iron-sulfur cluster assembly scaffold protein [Mesomycoplasma conjunctivae]VEU66145.1 nitrogen fixation protein NIFU [Mesomycoplasma conjunctivae]
MYNDFNKRRAIILQSANNLVNDETVCKTGQFYYNNYCDDAIALEIEIKNGKIVQVKTCAHGCTILKSAANLIANQILDKNLQDVKKLLSDYQKMLENQEINLDLQDLNALVNTKNHKNRLVCATLFSVAIREKIKEFEDG